MRGDRAGREPNAHPALQGDIVLAAIPFANFFLIITALYHVKPASRSLFITALGSDNLVYAWIATAVVLGAVLIVYHALVARVRRSRLIFATASLFVAGLAGFRIALEGEPAPLVAASFLVFVDVFAVVQVEQFWSQVNSLHDTNSGRRWYAYVGTGGLVGGVVGGAVAAALIRYTPLQTVDLLLVAAVMVATTGGLAVLIQRLAPGAGVGAAVPAFGDWRELGRGRYIGLIAAILLLAQLATPLVEYQFLHMVEAHYVDQEARTAFLSGFFSMLGIVAIMVNLVVTRAVHRYLGVIAGLLVQPLAMALSSLAFVAQPGLSTSMMLKISDRGLSYSINRASRELLYVPVDPVTLFRAKAWIDMFGYRLSKALGSGLILLLTLAIPWPVSTDGLSWVTISLCAIWGFVLLRLRCEYWRALGEAPDMAAGDRVACR